MQNALFSIILVSILNSFYCLRPFPTNDKSHLVLPRLNSTKSYLPTNSWFQNLLLNKGDSPIQTYPYIVKALENGLSISYSRELISEADSLSEKIMDDILLNTVEKYSQPIIDRTSVDADFFDLSVKINFGTKFNVILVRGSASIVANFYSSTPKISLKSTVDNYFQLNRRCLKLNLSNGQVWLIQSESTIKWDTNSNDFFGESPFTGWIKISIAVSEQAEEYLKIYGDLIPIKSGKINYKVERIYAPNSITVRCEYNNEGLFYLLPHVYQSNQTGATIINGAVARGVKGKYLLASGRYYQYKLPIYPSSDVTKAFDSKEKKDEISNSLKEDSSKLNFKSRDLYLGGKELSRASQLLKIADLLNDTESLNRIKTILTKELDEFWFGIKNNNSNFLYEKTWSGIISRGSIGSAETENGHYYFNNHHVHYGYFINVASTLAKVDPEYYNARKEYFDIILADYAGTCFYNKLPCKPRAKDPFLGISFEDGLFESVSSKYQVSVSESCNSYYAVRELGKYINDLSLRNLGDYLLSSEILAAKTYFQIKKETDIYLPPFYENGIVEKLSETKAEFSSKKPKELIFSQKILPFNEITQQYLDKNWLAETRNIWSQFITDSNIKDEYKGLFLLVDSILNPNETELIKKIRGLNSFDSGNSKTNTLFYYYMVGGKYLSFSDQVTNQNTLSSTQSSNGFDRTTSLNNQPTQTIDNNNTKTTTNDNIYTEFTHSETTESIESMTTKLDENTSLLSSDSTETIENTDGETTATETIENTDAETSATETMENTDGETTATETIENTDAETTAIETIENTDAETTAIFTEFTNSNTKESMTAEIDENTSDLSSDSSTYGIEHKHSTEALNDVSGRSFESKPLITNTNSFATYSNLLTSTDEQTLFCDESNCPDVGKPFEEKCPLANGLTGCFFLNGTFFQCYDQKVQGCYIGGNICTKPFLPCINPSNIQPGAECYNLAIKECVNGAVFERPS